MEPLTLKTASAVVKAVVENLNPLIEKANARARGDAQYYTSYIEIARNAVNGLYNEYAAILREVVLSDLRDVSTREALTKRIYDYMHGETLRPALSGAISHLREGRPELEEHVESLFIFARTAEKRAAAISKFDELLEKLHGVLFQLGSEHGPSAVALNDIKKLDGKLRTEPFDTRAATELADELVMNLDKSMILSLRNNCESVIESLRIAFR